MQLGMVGLGRMGANMARRLLRGGHQCVVFNRSPKPVQELVKEKATGASDLPDLAKKLASMMIGGEPEIVARLDPIFATLAPGLGNTSRTPGRDKLGGTAEMGYLHCGPNGAGHFVKMVHNGIEYGVMAAYAEGLGVLRSANIGKQEHHVDAETTPF